MPVKALRAVWIERRRNHKPTRSRKACELRVALYPSAGRMAGLTGMAFPPFEISVAPFLCVMPFPP